ncbi:MAG: DinB family protein [Chloroflexia bacterium]
MSDAAPGTETRNLLRYLNAQREHVLGILEGLDDEALRRSILPSGWSCLGLVQHLALDVERFWFRCTVASEQDAIDSLATIDNAWQVGADMPAVAVFDLYRDEVARANAIIAATPPDNAPAWWPPELFGDWRLDTVREIILHVMTETASHAGHLDIVRELIDGKRWLIMTD